MSREAFEASASVTVVDFANEPPREVWVVSSPTGPDLVTLNKAEAMQHAAELSGEFPESGPFRVCQYAAIPFAQKAALAWAYEDAARVCDTHRKLTYSDCADTLGKASSAIRERAKEVAR